MCITNFLEAIFDVYGEHTVEVVTDHSTEHLCASYKESKETKDRLYKEYRRNRQRNTHLTIGRVK